MVSPFSLPSISTIKSDIRSRPWRWGTALVALLLMVDILSMAAWMSFPGLKIEKISADTPPQSAPASSNILQLVEKMQSSGATLSPVEGAELQREPFSVPGTLMTLQGDNVQVFEYPDQSSASKEAGEFLKSYDRSSARTSWMPSMRLYKTESLLVLYTGNRSEIVSALDKALGTPLGSG